VSTDFFKIACDITNAHAAKLMEDMLAPPAAEVRTPQQRMDAAWSAWKDAEAAADIAQMRAHNAEHDYTQLLVELAQRRAGDVVKP
jgi:hypothetical protein